MQSAVRWPSANACAESGISVTRPSSPFRAGVGWGEGTGRPRHGRRPGLGNAHCKKINMQRDGYTLGRGYVSFRFTAVDDAVVVEMEGVSKMLMEDFL